MSDAVLQTLIQSVAGVIGTLATIGIPAWFAYKSLTKKLDEAKQETEKIAAQAASNARVSHRNAKAIEVVSQKVDSATDAMNQTATMMRLNLPKDET